jgi:hypothetical protein
MRSSLVVIMLASATAAAETRLEGVVIDVTTGRPVEGAEVWINSARGPEAVATSDANGHYSLEVTPGPHDIMFKHGESRRVDRITVEADTTAMLDGKVDGTAGEVIEIHDPITPTVLPEPINYDRRRLPPYSDEAILKNVWTVAWLLLDVDVTGHVRRLKFLKRPGYGLDPIARTQAFAQSFTPARNELGHPVAVRLVWKLEWPSADNFSTLTERIPLVGIQPRLATELVRCAQDFGFDPRWGYRDCSKPDLKKADTEAWVLPTR